MQNLTIVLHEHINAENLIAFSLLNLIWFKHHFLLRLEECEYVSVENLLYIKFW